MESPTTARLCSVLRRNAESSKNAESRSEAANEVVLNARLKGTPEQKEGRASCIYLHMRVASRTEENMLWKGEKDAEGL